MKLQTDLQDTKSTLKSELAKRELLEAKVKASVEYRSAAEQRVKKIQTEMSEANKAKNLAECNLSSIQYEYEQYKNKTKARERELVEQIDEKTHESQVKLLNAKVAELTKSNKQLEVVVWDLESKLNASMESNGHLQKEIQSLMLNLNEAKIELENKEPVVSNAMDGETSKAVDVLCVLLKCALDEGEQSVAELRQLRTKYDVVGREKADAVNERNIVIANYEETLVQVKQDHCVAMSALESELGELNKRLIVAASTQERSTQTEQCSCERFEREKGMLEEICSKLRITVQFAVNELAILRHSYAELEMSFARQELDNLKLQKTISENDDEFGENSVFASTMAASTTNISDDTVLADCSAVQRDDGTQATSALRTNIREFSEMCATHENNWRRLAECLSDASTFEGIDKLLSKIEQLKKKAAEHDRLLEAMITANASFSQCENIENAIIESQQKLVETSEQLLLITNNYR